MCSVSLCSTSSSRLTLSVPRKSKIYACYKELDKRFAVVGSKRVTKQARVEATVLNSLTPVSKTDIGKILPDVSATTIEAVLGQMVRDGQIRKVGTGRNTRYIRTGF